jgi:hypothetical protein
VDKVASAVGRRNCARATTALREAQDRADNLPGSVDPKLRRNIDDGLSQLVTNVESQCSTTTTSTQTTQTQTVPTQTETTPTETTPPPTETTPPPTETTPNVEPPSNNDQTGGTSPGQLKKLRRHGGAD